VTQNETNNDLFSLNEELKAVKDQIEECNGGRSDAGNSGQGA